MSGSVRSPLGGVWRLRATLEDMEPQAILGRLNIISEEMPNLGRKGSPC